MKIFSFSDLSNFFAYFAYFTIKYNGTFIITIYIQTETISLELQKI